MKTCIADCKGGKKKGGKDPEMLRCCSCMRWFHLACVNEKGEGIWNCPSCQKLPFMVTELLDMVKTLTDDFNAYKLQTSSAIEHLTNECQHLRDENRKLVEKVSNPASARMAQPPSTNSDLPKTFAQVVKTSVQSVIREEKVKSDVILLNVKDAKQDSSDVKTLCHDIGFPSQPIGIQRLGKSQENRHRLLKVSFSTSFDARAFQAKFDEARKDDVAKVRGIRCRPGRTKAEQEQFSKLNKAVYKLNQEASDSESYSLRSNMQIWRFARSDEGQWKRDADWSYRPSSPAASGNSSGSPQSH